MGLGSIKLYRTLFMMSYVVIFFCLVIFVGFSLVDAQDWNQVSDGHFEILTMARADEVHLPEVFAILRDAKKDLRLTWGLVLPQDIQIYIHPTLSSYSEVTELPWSVAAIANREELQIDMQRIQVLLERNSLEKTLRHELYHLAQEEDLERWQAEGRAMIFAGELPMADTYEGIESEVLNQKLEGFVDSEGLARANFLKATATAYQWAQRELASKEQDN